MSAIQTLPVGVLGTNCSLLQLPGSDTLYLIDPGGDPNAILDAVRSKIFKTAKILLTHAHADHIAAVPPLVEEMGIRTVFLAAADKEIYRSPGNCVEPFLPRVTGLPETVSELDDPAIQVLPCPGHTPGGTSFYVPSLKTVFAGDSLFQGSIGRTDLPGGNHQTLIDSIREQLFSLPEDTVVISGHGPPTSIGYEKRSNPYLA